MKAIRRVLLLCCLLTVALCTAALADDVLTLPANLTVIEEESFAGLDQARTVIVPEGVTNIQARAFADSKLTLVQLPSTVTVIGEGAFRDCGTSSQRRLYLLPEGVTVGADAFTGCTARITYDGEDLSYMTYTVGEDSVTVTGYSGADAELTIPDTIEGKPVTAIGNNAFSGKQNLTAVNLPAGLKTIGRAAFENCKALPSVMLPTGLETIGANAFNDCSALTEAAIPESVTAIGEKAFRYTAITEVSVPQGAALGTEVFGSCQKLVSASLPDSLTEIPDYLFYNCRALAQVSLPQSLTAIGREAFNNTFYNQQGSAVYVLPDTLTTLGAGAFNGCGAGLCVSKGGDTETLMRDNNYAFTHPNETDFRYKHLSATVDGEKVWTKTLIRYVGAGGAVVIPASATVIGEEAFRDNTTVTAVTIPEGVTSIRKWAFQRCSALASVQLPQSLNEVLDFAFNNCAQLTSVNFPAALTVIKGDAFSGTCKAEGTYYFDLPDNLAECSAYSFNNCGAVLCVTRDSGAEAQMIQCRYIFAYKDSRDFRYQMESGAGAKLRLESYAGTDSPVRLPDDCVSVNRNNFSPLVDGGLVCAQNSDTAAALDKVSLNYTFPGDAFADFRYRKIEDVLYIMGYAGSDEQITVPVPGDYITAGVDVQIRANAFKGMEQLTKVTVGEGVTRINSDAFTNCYNLSDITLPSTLTSLDQNVFLWCGRDAAQPFYLVLPDNMTDLVGRGGGATTFLDFNAVLVCGKTSATAALLTDRNYVYTVAGEEDFRYRYEKDETDSSIRRLWLVGYAGEGARVNIPQGIYGIKRYIQNTTANYWRTFHGDGFYGNETVTEVTIPEGTVEIGKSAFENCVSLTDITFPDSLRKLKDGAFKACGSASATIHYYVLPDDIEEIGTNKAAGWGTFVNINNGRLVCGVGSTTARVLSECDNDWPTAWDFALKGHQTDGLLYHYVRHGEEGSYTYKLYLTQYEGTDEEVEIPADCGVYRIENAVFQDHTELQKIVIPAGIVEIGADAFNGCTTLCGGTDAEPNAIILPNTLKKLGDRAFKDVGAAVTNRFYLVLPASLENFNVGIIDGCGAVFVAGGTAATVLYNEWYYYYITLEDAKVPQNLQYQLEYDEQTQSYVPHAFYYGKQ